MRERNRDEPPARRNHLGGTGGRRRRVVAALDQHVRPAGDDQISRRVAVERYDQVDGGQRREHRHAVGERVERTVITLAEPADGRVGVHGDDERGVVYLRGLVTRQEGEIAASIAATTDGVVRVVKVFEYTN